jgi:hypothetical protein
MFWALIICIIIGAVVRHIITTAAADKNTEVVTGVRVIRPTAPDALNKGAFIVEEWGPIASDEWGSIPMGPAPRRQHKKEVVPRGITFNGVELSDDIEVKDAGSGSWTFEEMEAADRFLTALKQVGSQRISAVSRLRAPKNTKRNNGRKVRTTK